MQGKLMMTYSLICDNDTYLEISIKELLDNEKIVKLLKSEFLKGIRNLDVSGSYSDAKIILSTKKEIYSFEAQKKDFADLIELAEEDAKKRKLLKKGCDAVEIIDFETL
jgi:hypothetical protein